MSKPLWTFVLIARNESKTLPRLVSSLREFSDRGGQTIVVDTGSTDGTPEVARNLGCIVYEEGTRFQTQISPELAADMNTRFVVGDEQPVVQANQKLFNYAAARNYAASKSDTDVIAMPDCDEVWTALKIDVINQAILDGVEQFEYNFVFSHDQFGNEVIKFLHSKFYDRRKLHWEGIVHEVLHGNARRVFFDESVMKLEHWQNVETNRGGYLTGLALDCFENPQKDRNSHYFAREMMFTGRFKSAIKEFERHVAMDKWLQEKAQSIIYIGDCYGYLGNTEQAVQHYLKAFTLDGTRREALLRLAEVYFKRNDPQRCAAYANAALTIPWNNYYSNLMSDYTNVPHQYLYWALWWMGDRKGSKEHWKKAYGYQPNNPKYRYDSVFYSDYPDNGIDGPARYDECFWLYETAKGMNSVVAVGCETGQTIHALSTGCAQGTVTVVGQRDASFDQNTALRGNVEFAEGSSVDVVRNFKDKSVDMVFVNTDCEYELARTILSGWKTKAKLMLCGRNYSSLGIQKAVNETLGLVQTVPDTGIWYKRLFNPFVSIVVPTLGRPEKLNRLLEMIRENAGYAHYEVIVKVDDWPPRNKGVPLLIKEAVAESCGELVMYLGNDCMPQADFLLHAVSDMVRWFPQLDGLIGLNDGYWKGEVATHWLASKKLLPFLGGEFFHTGYFHVGCDNELTERCRKLKKYAYSERSQVAHDHPVQSGMRDDELDPVHRIAYADRRLLHDRTLLQNRSQTLGFRHRIISAKPVIPRQIFTIWLNEDTVTPEVIEKCLETHKIPGYRHKLITLKNCFKGSAYVQSCIDAKLWARAADYLRAYYLFCEGGFYLDADMEVLGDLEDYLIYRLVCQREDNGFVANSFIGSVAGHPLLKQYLDNLDATELTNLTAVSTWNTGMGAWTVLTHEASIKNESEVKILEIGTLQGTLHHHFYNSWVTTPAS